MPKLQHALRALELHGEDRKKQRMYRIPEDKQRTMRLHMAPNYEAVMDVVSGTLWLATSVEQLRQRAHDACQLRWQVDWAASDSKDAGDDVGGDDGTEWRRDKAAREHAEDHPDCCRREAAVRRQLKVLMRAHRQYHWSSRRLAKAAKNSRS
jgi:hypothetical protein